MSLKRVVYKNQNKNIKVLIVINFRRINTNIYRSRGKQNSQHYWQMSASWTDVPSFSIGKKAEARRKINKYHYSEYIKLNSQHDIEHMVFSATASVYNRIPKDKISTCIQDHLASIYETFYIKWNSSYIKLASDQPTSKKIAI